jgi:alpha-L-rhamnosidase
MKWNQGLRLFILCFMVLAAGCQASAQDISEQFRDPGKAYRPIVRWWWPGGDVQDPELRREVDLLDQANFGGAEIQAFTKGLNPNMPPEVQARVNDYLTPTFFEHVQAAVEEARAHGMWIDYTFGSGWPFGGAGVITPELATVELRYAHQSIQGPVHFHAILPTPQARAGQDGPLPQDWVKQFKQREKLVATVAVRGDDVQLSPTQQADQGQRVKSTAQLDPKTSVVLTQHMQPDGTLDWDVPPGTWQVFTFMELPRGQQVNAGIGIGPQLVLDHMSRRAFDVYAERVGGTLHQYDGQYFGKGLRAIFCDSLEVRAYLFWSDDFLQQFRQRRGYDLTPYLPLLREDAGVNGAAMPLYDIPGIGDHVRRDYWQTVSDVMIDNFYSPFIQWAAKNDLQSRIQAHGSPTDWLRVYGRASIPETENLYDGGRYDFLKMASSAADLYGRKIISSESFVWTGKAYQTTPEKIKRYADELFTAGINEIIYHGYPYEYMDRPFPGWHPFALVPGTYSSFMNQNNPFWPYLGRLNEYMTRLQYLSQTGKTVVRVLMYRGPLPYAVTEPTQSEIKLDNDLLGAGYDFDYIDDYALLHSKIVGGKLLSPGGATYRVLILQDQKYVSQELLQQLADFARHGFPIVFLGGTPGMLPEPVDGQLVPGVTNAPLEKLLTYKEVHTADPAGVIQTLNGSIAPNLHFGGPSLFFIEKRIGKLDIFFLRNPDNISKQTAIDCTAAGTPEIWDPWTGAIRPLAEFHRNGRTAHIPLYVDPYGSVLLVFDPEGKPAGTPVEMSAPARPAMQLAVDQKDWKFHGVGIGPGSRPETIDVEMPNLLDWSMSDRLKNFSGQGVYTTTFTVPAAMLGGNRQFVLDLGDVKDVAQISINGKPGPILLLQPYRADVSRLLHAGENTLQVTVVNGLFNALSAEGLSQNYRPESTGTANGLLPSGLIGPVRLEEIRR